MTEDPGPATFLAWPNLERYSPRRHGAYRRGQEPKPTGSTTPGTQPRTGGTLRLSYRLAGTPYGRGLDPHIQTTAHAGYMRLFYQTLLRANPRTWQLGPELAQHWEMPSPTDLIFTLAPGVKWQQKPPVNGQLLNAEDVVFSLERARGSDPRFINRSLLDPVEKLEAVDATRVWLRLKGVDASLLNNLATSPLAILAREVVERAGDRFATPDTAVGTDAFVLTELTDVAATLVRNPISWKQGLPYLDQVVTPVFADAESAWAALLGRQLDAMQQVPGTIAKRYSAEQGQFTVEARAVGEGAAEPGHWLVAVNTKREPSGDPRVYMALRLLLNHQELADTDFGVINGRG